MSNLLRLALEEASDGKANKEIERVFYAKLSDFEQLKKADSYEDQEQWEVPVARTEKNGGEGRIRIRKTTFQDGRVEYVLTTKLKMKGSRPGAQAAVEVSIPTTEANFAQFKILAENGMIKRRYHFPAGGLVWEIDVFPGCDKGKTQCDWVKIDLEMPSTSTAIPELPIQYDELIDGATQLSEKQQETLDWLYDNEFKSTNGYAS
jgi:CYTH domain-containing protein